MFRRLLVCLSLVLLGCVAADSLAEDEAQAWRRTTRGWELATEWQTTTPEATRSVRKEQAGFGETLAAMLLIVCGAVGGLYLLWREIDPIETPFCKVVYKNRESHRRQ